MRDHDDVSYSIRPVTVSAIVSADPDNLFEFVSDTRNDPIWCPNVSSVEQVSGDGVAVGSEFRFHQTVEAGGRTLQSDVDVEVLELGDRSIVWRVEDRFQVREIGVTVTPDGDSSKVTQTTKASFKRKPGLARWAYPRMARRVLRDQLARLADHFG